MAQSSKEKNIERVKILVQVGFCQSNVGKAARLLNMPRERVQKVYQHWLKLERIEKKREKKIEFEKKLKSLLVKRLPDLLILYRSSR